MDDYVDPKSSQLHLPLHNYAGPNTHIKHNIKSGLMPVNDLDAAALIHDLDYINPKVSQFEADNNMWKNLLRKSFFNMPVANFTRLALLAKDLFGYNPPKDYNAYLSFRQLAVKKGLIDPNMRFTTSN